MKKQNRDPNRSTRTSQTQANDRKTHNSSLHTISHSQQVISRPNGSNNKSVNSRILAEFKQSKIPAGRNQSNQGGTKTSLSTTRSNYKPKFILKDLMQQKQLFQSQNQSQSMCQEYFDVNQGQLHEVHQSSYGNGSNTFENSPLASESYCGFNKRQNNKLLSSIQNVNSNKSAISSKSIMPSKNGISSKMGIPQKKRQLQQEDSKTEEYQNTHNNSKNSYSMPIQNTNQQRKYSKIQKQQQYSYQSQNQHQKQEQKWDLKQNQQTHQNQQLYYNQQLHYNQQARQNLDQNQKKHQDNGQFRVIGQQIKKKSYKPTDHQSKQYQKMRSLSTQNPNSSSVVPTAQKVNYKVAYLQTKKLLDVRSAYFSQAIQLCKYIITNMKPALEQEYEQTESQRIIWCHQRCQDMLDAFQDYDQK